MAHKQNILEDQIKVVVRVRPLIPREVQQGAIVFWKTDGNFIRQQDPITFKFSSPFQFGK